jgi:hypothetical protein
VPFYVDAIQLWPRMTRTCLRLRRILPRRTRMRTRQPTFASMDVPRPAPHSTARRGQHARTQPDVRHVRWIQAADDDVDDIFSASDDSLASLIAVRDGYSDCRIRT